MGGVVRIGSLVVGLVVCFLPSKALSSSESVEHGHDHGEPSQHVMHIRKLADGDNLKIELEPVWFHLESSEQRPPAGETQQVKRQAGKESRRPYKVFTNVERLQQHARKQPLRPTTGNAEALLLQQFWHRDEAADQQPSESKQVSSFEEQLNDAELPACFRKYLNEMTDRNQESVRKLMRCLAQRADRRDQNEPRRARRYQSSYVGDQDTVNRDRKMNVEAKVMRKSNDRDGESVASSSELVGDDLMFQKHYIRSDSDDGGQVFEVVEQQRESENTSHMFDNTSERGLDADSSDGSDQKQSVHEPSDGRVPYRRLPTNFNTKWQYPSSEELDDDDSSCEDL
ncbi:uncharacterized protein LOC128269786 [Anopheles cruzii]|uniref:uncharacterized protein LOC128269786 n=1 Tax=Anopheles cruzii TaxID=68878 RepID=UPI0022EC922B|nr:uncharacterized protein LOC128269786 [Anopheles cruzii]